MRQRVEDPGRFVRLRRAASWRGLACVLAVAGTANACSSQDRGSLRHADPPSAEQVAASEERATATAKTFFRLLARNDERACSMLSRYAVNQLLREYDVGTCPEVLELVAERADDAYREKAEDFPITAAKATSRYRVELLTASRDPDEPIVVEYSGKRWVVVALA
ncbi:MAG: hypothetical protein AB7L84_09630 [Acidimicrobiia bacterium]